MRTIHIDEILRNPKRQRSSGRSQQDHQDLFTSISEGEAGLIHAPMLWEDGDKHWLVAGEGRLNVIKDMFDLGIPLRYEGQELEVGMVPYTLIGDTSELGRREAEFDENVKRTPLTVAERAAATAELFELKKMKAERDGTPAPTVADLSVEIRGSSAGDYQTQTKRELIVARHLDDPEVAAAKTMGEAFNVIKKKETQRKAVQIAQQMGGEVRTSTVEAFHADAVEWLQKCPDAKFDIVLSDPPYGIGADTFGEYNNSDEHRYDDSYEAWQSLMQSIVPQLARICKLDAHAYLFCDFDRFHELKKYMELAGWKVHRTPLIWVNPTGFRTPWPEHGPQRKCELILYARRGEKRVLKVMPDVIECARERDSFHPAQKPIELLRNILSRSALPSDAVLDFCAGSGSTAVACKAMKLACTVIEKDETSYGTILRRIHQP